MGGEAGLGPMNALWRELRPMLRYLAVLSFFMNLLFLVPAMFTLQVFDRVIPSNSRETLLVLLLGTGMALLLIMMLDYVRNRLQHVIGNIVDARISPPVIQAIVTKGAHAPHAVRADSVRDVAALRNVFAASGLIAIFDAPWVVVYVLVIWAFHPVLGAGAALAAALMLGLAWLNDRVGRRALDGVQREGRRATQYVESSLRNAEVLQALGMTENLLGRWRRMQDYVMALQSDAGRRNVTFAVATRFSRQAIQAGMLALGAYLVLSQQSSSGIMIATTILLGRALQPVEQLVASWRVLSDARAAYRRLAQLGSNIGSSAERLALPRPAGRLVANGISYRAADSDKPILMNVALEIEPGEALAIIGPSGSGKSTLARLLTGVRPSSSGTVRLDGADIADWPRRDLGKWVGYVPQDVEIFDGTVAENIARLGAVDDDAVVAAAQRAGAHEMILGLDRGYDTVVGEQGTRLSPGQRQRIALARALYGDPRLVVLDEPNSNLDGAGEIALAEALSGLRADGVTSVVVTHRPSLISHVDKILILEAGRVRQFGAASEIMKGTHRQGPVIVGRRAS